MASFQPSQTQQYQVTLTKDTSDLEITRCLPEQGYVYYIRSEDIWIDSTGRFTQLGEYPEASSYEEGILEGENAAIFRALATLNKMIQAFTEKLHTNTTLFNKNEVMEQTSMSRTAKPKPPEIDINRNKALERFRKLGGFLAAHPDKVVSTDEVLKYITQDNAGGDPSSFIEVR